MAIAKYNPNSKLSEDEIQIILDDTLSARPMRITAKTLGFSTKMQLHRWYIKNPEVNARVREMRIEACESIEDDLLDLPALFPDSKMAKVMLETYTRLLAFRVPSKYSQRIDMNVNQHVSITFNLNNANSRMAELIKTVAPAALTGS